MKKHTSSILPASLAPYRKALCCLAVLVSIFLFLQILDASMGAVLKFLAAAIVLVACGEFVRREYSLDGGWGLIMLRSKTGLSLIDSLAKKNETLLKWFADIGLVVCFGFLSYFMMSKEARNPKRLIVLFLVGFPLLAILALFVAPSVFPILASALNTFDFAQSGAKIRASASGFSFFDILMLSSIVIGGFALFTTISLISYAILIVGAVVGAIGGNSTALNNTAPGATFILPGINLPLFEAVLALAIMLVVHECAHGLLARAGKIKLNSAGLVFLGFLPMGAFIDPDEKQLKKADMHTQNRVLVAGSMSNFITSFVLFIVLLLFVFATYNFRADGVRVEAGTLPRGSIIFETNGTLTSNSSPLYAETGIMKLNGKYLGSFENITFMPNSTVTVLTDKGVFIRNATADGKIGILYNVVLKSGRGWLVYYPNNALLMFIYTTLALAFALNFVVGTINLVPLPFFDGFQMLDATVKNKHVVQAIMVLLVAAFAANFLPWLFR
ncbi:Peptidase family M50 [Candidatus Anstonella stagnisolia]|nr:Peptidase family M50 [Candidatus Anstonella stagnisolia]